MEKILSIKEKIKNVNSLIENLENDDFSLIEKDIVLQDLRDLYVIINSLQFDDSKIKPETIKKEDPIVVEKPAETVVVEALNEDIIEFADEIEEQETIVEETPVEEKVIEEISIPKQQNLFGSGNISSSNGGVKTVGEQLGQNKTSLNERLADKSATNDVASRISQKPITDIKAAIGIGDRFLYIRELFGGNNELFEQTINQLNAMNSFGEAETFLLGNFDWDYSQETVLNFASIVRRKYL